MEEIRLQKYLADNGIASRRKCEELILQGKVKVNEITITFTEGINIRDLARIVDSNTSNSEDDVYNKLKDEKYIDYLIDKYWFLTDEIKSKNIYYFDAYCHFFIDYNITNDYIWTT